MPVPARDLAPVASPEAIPNGGDPAIILFDLDGVLIDPRIGITRSVQFALGRLGIMVDDADSLTPFIGPPLIASFQHVYGLSTTDAHLAVQHYRERFSVLGVREYSVYRGVSGLLSRLHRAGRTLLIASSKPEVFVRQIMDEAHLAPYFTIIAGATLDHTRDAKAEVIRHALDQLSADAGGARLMIGDREHDIIGARLNALPAIAVTWGYGDRAELEAAAPLAIAESPGHLGRLLGLV